MLENVEKSPHINRRGRARTGSLTKLVSSETNAAKKKKKVLSMHGLK